MVVAIAQARAGSIGEGCKNPVGYFFNAATEGATKRASGLRLGRHRSSYRNAFLNTQRHTWPFFCISSVAGLSRSITVTARHSSVRGLFAHALCPI